eukprot:scaffold268865_cov46-Prasinocladus_malaysianus.AAC.1
MNIYVGVAGFVWSGFLVHSCLSPLLHTENPRAESHLREAAGADPEPQRRRPGAGGREAEVFDARCRVGGREGPRDGAQGSALYFAQLALSDRPYIYIHIYETTIHVSSD